jgi:hypothetical protein
MENEKNDLNGESVPEENGQPQEAEPVKEVDVAETTDTEETLPEWAKEKMSKLEEERENYKQGMLKYKKHTLGAEEEVEETKEEEYPDWDDTSKKFQKQTLTEAQKIAKEVATKEISKRNEQDAITQFLNTHPEAEDKWDDIVSNYTAKSGKDSVNSVLKDLNKAYVVTRYESGELEKMKEEATKKGEAKGVAKAKLAELSSVSKTTSKVADKGSNALSPGALKLAEKMRVDPKKLAEEDDSLTAEIKY